MRANQRVSAPQRSTDGFDRLLRHVVRDILLPRTLEGAILASQPPGIRGMSAKKGCLCLESNRAARREHCSHLRRITQTDVTAYDSY
jgi:hypothetical protein